MTNLATALAAFQGAMPVVAKSHTAKVAMKGGGQYSYTYADLADVTEQAMPLLAANGLSFSCLPTMGERGYELRGVLLHTSGERMEGSLPIAGNSPQELGSSLTYMRRYLLGAMTGVVTDDDDDGSLAQQAAKRPAAKKASHPPPTQPEQTYDERVTEDREAGGEPVAPPVRGQRSGIPTQPAEKASEGPMRPKTRARMFALFGQAGINDRDEQIRGIAHIVGHDVESRGQLSDSEAHQVIRRLEEKVKAGASA